MKVLKIMIAAVLVLVFTLFFNIKPNNTFAQTAPADSNKLATKRHMGVRKDNCCPGKPNNYNYGFKKGDHVQWRISDKLHTGTIVGNKNVQTYLVKSDSSGKNEEVLYKDLKHLSNTKQ